jgi:membrane protein DedA with SNARE-associated domain
VAEFDPAHLLAGLVARPALFFLAVVLMSFLLEDATALAAGALAATGAVQAGLALAAVFTGIVLGDFLLHLAGRAARRSPRVARLLPPGSLRERLGQSVPLVAAARFVPGLRLPVYTGSGLAAMNPLLFLLAVTATAILWVPLLFGAGGQLMLAERGGLLVVAVLALVALPWLLGPSLRRAVARRLT